MAEQTNGAPATFFQRTEDFISLYANNFQVEQSAFDLKLIFGELNQSENKVRVDQHSSVTIPWVQAKLLIYYLQVNLAGFEVQRGKIKIPNDLLPSPVPPVPSEQKNDPKIQELFELIKKIREQFVTNL